MRATRSMGGQRNRKWKSNQGKGDGDSSPSPSYSTSEENLPRKRMKKSNRRNIGTLSRVIKYLFPSIKSVLTLMNN
jgi:hypothetical protein